MITSILKSHPHVHRSFVTLLCLLMIVPNIALLPNIAYAHTSPQGQNGTNACNTPCAGCGCGEECPDMGHTADGALPSTTLPEPLNMVIHSTLERNTDLRLPGPVFGWSHLRTYDSRLSRLGTGGGVGGDLYSFEGSRTHGGGLGHYLRYHEPNDPNTSDAQLYIDATSHRIFENSNSNPASPPSYTAPPDAPLTMKRTGSDENEEFEVTNVETGKVWKLYGINSEIDSEKRGMMKEITSQACIAQGVTGTTFNYMSNGMVDWVLTPQGWTVNYTYISSGTNKDRLQKVEVFNGTTHDTLLQQVVYTYFDSTDTNLHSDLGDDGDLIQVKVSRHDSATGLYIVRTTQYRYFTSNYLVGQVKMVLEADAIERILDEKTTWTSDTILEKPDSEVITTINSSDKKIEDFASRSFEYYTDNSLPGSTSWGTENLIDKYGDNQNSEHKAMEYQYDYYWGGATSSETVNGACASCGSDASGSIKKEYYYFQLADWYKFEGMDEPNQVVRIAIEDTLDADGNERYRRIFGLNYNGTAIRQALLTNPNSPSENNIWCSSIKLNDDWRVEERRMPSAHKGMVADNDDLKKFLDPYDPDATGNKWANDEDTVNASDGIVYFYEYGAGIRLSATRLSRGANGLSNSNFLTATDWSNHATTGEHYLPDKTYVYPTASNSRTATDRIETSYAYTFHDSDNLAVKTIATTLPAIDNSTQNGSGVATTTYQFFDELGRLRWTKDGEGYVDYYSYHPDTGGQAVMITDVNTASLPSEVTTDGSGTRLAWSDSVPSDSGNYDFSRESGLPNALNLIAKTEYDDQGRTTKTIGPGGDIHETLYFADGILRLPYVDGTGSPQLPARVSKTNAAGVLVETYVVDPATVDSSATALPTTTSDFVSRTVYSYNAVNGQLEQVDRYHDLDGTTGEGTDKQYYGTRYLYDNLGRRGATIRYVEDGKYQVTVNVLDLHGRVTEVRHGVVSSPPTNYSTLDDANPPTGYVSVRETEYDKGTVGDSRITKTKTYFDTNDYIGANYHRDWRGQLRGMEGFYKNGGNDTAIGPYRVKDYDWRGQVVASATYADGTSITWDDGDPNTSSDVVDDDTYISTHSTGRNNLTKTLYDDLGRVYQTQRSPGSEGSKYFEINNYYDRNGRLVCTGDKYSAHTEFAYDGAGRRYQTRTVKDAPASTAYTSGAYDYAEPAPNPSLSSMSNEEDSIEGLIEFSHIVYDDGSNVIEQHDFELNHDDTDGIDIDATDSFVRRSIYAWYDDADRLVTMSDHGSGDGSGSGTGSWEYTALSTSVTEPTASSAAELVTLYSYNDDTGRLETITDPAGSETKTFYDDLGRRTFVAENYTDFAPPSTNIGGGTNNDEDRVTGWEYNGLGQTTKLTAYNASISTGDQETVYLYEDDHNASLVTNTIYPDSADTTSSGTDQVKRTYNLDGSLATMTDQREVEHTYYYNDRRQLERDAVDLTNSSGVDDAVLAIKRTYDDLGRLSQITSYGDSAGTSNPVNGIYYTYQATGQLDYVYQDHSGEADTSDLSVNYTDDSSTTSNVYNDGLRIHSIVYPGGSIARWERGGTSAWNHTDNLDDRLSRVNRLRFEPISGGSGDLVEYSYNGTNQLVKLDFIEEWQGTEPRIHREMFDSSNNNDYDAFDRFGRTLRHQWEDYTSTVTTVDQMDYTYDYAGNRLKREVDGDSSLDQTYTYDGLHRLKSVDEDSSSTTNDRYWELDQLGNWDVLRHGLTSSADKLEDRSHNSANELTSTEYYSGGGIDDELSFTFDEAGNMTKMPTITGTADYDDLKYDAWNRLVEVKAGSTVVQENEYDGLNRRIVRDETGGGGKKIHYYYNNQWQVLEERVESGGTIDPNPLAQYIYHPHYVDAVAVRFYDSDTDGTLDGDIDAANDGKQFYLHDANFNVTAVTDDTGTVLERYHYSPYGAVTYLDSSFLNPSSSSLISNEFLYTGRRLDPETGLQLNRNRFYASHLGRWVNRDPIEYWGGFNLYGYVGGMPIVFVDPVGLQRIEWPPPKAGGPPPRWPKNEDPVTWPKGSFPKPTGSPNPNKPPLRPLPGKPPGPGDGGPGGTPRPGSGGYNQNCFGNACGKDETINWPGLGPNCNRNMVQAAISFVPAGCQAVSCKGVDQSNTRCKKGQTELIIFIYIFKDPKIPSCDFHAVGREIGDQASNWHSKKDQRECIDNITDPLQSLWDAYPDTKEKKDADGLPVVMKRCFCCDPDKMQTVPAW